MGIGRELWQTEDGLSAFQGWWVKAVPFLGRRRCERAVRVTRQLDQFAGVGHLGYWTGVQHSESMMKGKDKPISMQLRVTEVFRKEGGEWNLVHRHADMIPNDK